MDTMEHRCGSAWMSRSLVKSSVLLAVGVFVVWVMGHGVAAAAGPSLDSEGGFRDAKLGVPHSSFRGLVKTHTYKGTDYYKRQGDNLSYGGVKLEAILYGFSGGVLGRIQLRTPPEKEPGPCQGSARFEALRRTVESYSDVSFAYESDPFSPSDPLVNECLAEAGSEACVVLVYQTKKIQVRLRAIEKQQQEETSRRVLTAEQVSAFLWKIDAKPLGGQKDAASGKASAEIDALREAQAYVTMERLRRLGAPEAATFYEGGDGSTIAVAKLSGGRFDVITLKDVSFCYQMVEFSLVPSRDDWVGEVLEKMEKEKKSGPQKP